MEVVHNVAAGIAHDRAASFATTDFRLLQGAHFHEFLANKFTDADQDRSILGFLDIFLGPRDYHYSDDLQGYHPSNLLKLLSLGIGVGSAWFYLDGAEDAGKLLKNQWGLTPNNTWTGKGWEGNQTCCEQLDDVLKASGAGENALLGVLTTESFMVDVREKIFGKSIPVHEPDRQEADRKAKDLIQALFRLTRENESIADWYDKNKRFVEVLTLAALASISPIVIGKFAPMAWGSGISNYFQNYFGMDKRADTSVPKSPAEAGKRAYVKARDQALVDFLQLTKPQQKFKMDRIAAIFQEVTDAVPDEKVGKQRALELAFLNLGIPEGELIPDPDEPSKLVPMLTKAHLDKLEAKITAKLASENFDPDEPILVKFPEGDSPHPPVGKENFKLKASNFISGNLLFSAFIGSFGFARPGMQFSEKYMFGDTDPLNFIFGVLSALPTWYMAKESAEKVAEAIKELFGLTPEKFDFATAFASDNRAAYVFLQILKFVNIVYGLPSGATSAAVCYDAAQALVNIRGAAVMSEVSGMMMANVINIYYVWDLFIKPVYIEVAKKTWASEHNRRLHAFHAACQQSNDLMRSMTDIKFIDFMNDMTDFPVPLNPGDLQDYDSPDFRLTCKINGVLNAGVGKQDREKISKLILGLDHIAVIHTVREKVQHYTSLDSYRDRSLTDRMLAKILCCSRNTGVFGGNLRYRPLNEFTDDEEASLLDSSAPKNAPVETRDGSYRPWVVNTLRK